MRLARPGFMQLSFFGPRRWRLVAVSIGGVALASVVAALLLLSYGWTWLRHPLELRLTASLAHRVTIGSIRRIDHGFLQATLVIDDVRVAQPDWVGGGDFVRLHRAIVRLPILPLLRASVRPTSVEIDGLVVRLVRKDGDRANWKKLPIGGGAGGGGGRAAPAHLAIRDGTLIFDDYKRAHFFRARVAADDRAFIVEGGGTLIGRPTRLRLTGPALLGSGRWPFRLDYRSSIANVALAGVADAPLDLGHFDATAHAWGDDAKHLDLLVEAGLPGTAPVDLTASLRRDRPDWRIGALAATIGRSHLSGAIDIRKRDERTLLTGHVVSAALDFDDLANAEGRARAAARHAAAPGRRLPDTKIDLSHLAKTDAKVDVDIRRLLFRKPSAFKSMRGTLAIDHGVLTIAPFVVGLERGTLGGTVRVTQAAASTRLALDLRLRGGRIEAMATDASAFSGALDGRFVLEGPGHTIRAALGAASGRFAIVGRDGTLGRQVALLLGQDVGRGAFAKKDDVARLRCGIGSFVVRGGKAVPHPLLIDTSVARAEATGLLDLTDERIDLALTGAPKQASILRLSGPIRVTGQLFAPAVAAPQATSTKGILKSLGRAISGKAQPLAADADCAGLAARALR